MRVASTNRLPFAVQEALVQVAGQAFWYKTPLRHALTRAGVPEPLVRPLSSLTKYELMREVLQELDARGSAGVRVQHQIVRELASLRTFGDEVDGDKAAAAVSALRAVAEEQGILHSPAARRADAERQTVERRRAEKDERNRQAAARLAALSELHRDFCRLLADHSDPQDRGYRLETLLGRLIRLEGLEYRPPFRKEMVSQTDGFFTFESFQYLIEARWRESQPNANDLAAFAAKVERTLQSTRGLFLSIAGFRSEVVDEIARGRRNLILMSGTEFALILEGRLSFREAMSRKVAEAAQRGNLFYEVA